ncbi:MAG: class I SAM-dependent methyltransferase [Halobacteriota archaeon]
MVSNQSTETVIEQQVAEYDDDLELYLSQIGKIFDIPHIINEPQGKQQIIDYYVSGKFGLKLYSAEGFYHYGISYDGRYKKEDFKEQARIVEKHVRDSDSKNVLELACGMGGNMAVLARRNPHVMFDGVDLALKPLKRFTKTPNVDFQLGDYHDLSAFKDSAYDIVFVIEALCYSTNKLQVLREVKKKLKRDGLFIVIDAYRRDRATPLSPSEKTMQKLIEMSWSLDKFEYVKDVEGYMREEYSIAVAKDFSQCVLPSATKIARKFRYYFAHPMFARVVNKLLPFDVAKGFIAAYLYPTSSRRQIACYYIHVLKNDK